MQDVEGYLGLVGSLPVCQRALRASSGGGQELIEASGGAGQISGPYEDNNADIILDLLSDAYEAGFVASPDLGATVSVGGDFPDETFVKLCVNLVPLCQQVEINSTLYIRTPAGLAPKV